MTDDNVGSDRVRSQAQPIFILGILPRCGTNFLSELLCLHPDCAPSAPVPEDFLVAHTDLLDRYIDKVHKRWNPSWDTEGTVRGLLAASLGSGLTSFLADQAEAKRVVAKTPRVENLGRFFRFFPDARLLILVRDGRAVLESGIKSFGWHRDSALHRLAGAARTIHEFDVAGRDSPWRDRYRIVRYEDLWTNLQDEMREILKFLELDSDRYDFSAAKNLPIRGSSTVRQDGSGDMHWKPVKKTAEFDPMSRFHHWRRAQHARFNWVAGKHLEPFGYEMAHRNSSKLFWILWNVLLDLKWQIVRTLGSIYLKLKGERR